MRTLWQTIKRILTKSPRPLEFKAISRFRMNGALFEPGDILTLGATPDASDLLNLGRIAPLNRKAQSATRIVELATWSPLSYDDKQRLRPKSAFRVRDY